MIEKDVIEQLSLLEPSETDTPRPASQALAQIKTQVRKEHEMSWQYKFSKTLSSSQGRLRLGSAFAA
jgi:hypothetical protein